MPYRGATTIYPKGGLSRFDSNRVSRRTVTGASRSQLERSSWGTRAAQAPRCGYRGRGSLRQMGHEGGASAPTQIRSKRALSIFR